MLSRTSKGMMITLTFIIGTIFIFDLFTIIVGLFVSPILDGYGLPDIFIYMKASVFLIIFVMLFFWMQNKNFNITKSNLKILLTIAFILIVVYFMSLYVYKYSLLLDTASIIKNKILEGNASLALNFSMINYRTLDYINTIYGGFNSEFVLFFEALAIQMVLVKMEKLEIVTEEVHKYDRFMYDNILFYIFFILSITSFVSINIFKYRFDTLGSVEVGIGIIGFILATAGLIPAFNISRNKKFSSTKSFLLGNYKFMLSVSVLGVIAYGALFGLNVLFLSMERGTYRIGFALVSFLLSLVIIYRVRKTIVLENK
jgi:hypothetical protein